MAERKSILLRLDPKVHDALARWASDELRSTTAQIEFLLRQGLAQAGRLPREVGGMPRRGRPPKEPAQTPEAGQAEGEEPTDASPATTAAAGTDAPETAAEPDRPT
jgi:hypothetical protein